MCHLSEQIKVNGRCPRATREFIKLRPCDFIHKRRGRAFLIFIFARGDRVSARSHRSPHSALRAPLFNFFNDRAREQRRTRLLVKRPLKPKVAALRESGARERRNAAQIPLEMHMMKLISRRRRGRPRNVCKNALSHAAERIASINEL